MTPELEQRRIVMRNVTKILGRGRHKYYCLDTVNMVFESINHYVILGVQGSGKSTLLRVLAGMQKIGRGSIEQYGKVMPPMGAALAFSEGSSGRDLCKVFAQLYDADPHEIIEFVLAFSGVGEHFNRPTDELPPEMRSRLAFALGYAIPADFYLFDGTFAAGTPAFRDRCKAAFQERYESAGTIFATRDLRAAPSYGDRGIILHRAKLHLFNTVEEAVYAYHYLELEPDYGTLKYASELFAKGKFEEAKTYLDETGLVNSDDHVANELFAKISIELGDDVSAKLAATQALSIDSTLLSPHLLLARIAARNADNAGVITHAEAFLSHQPENKDARLLLARAHEAVGSYGLAAANWRGLVDGGANRLALRLAIRCELKAEQWDAALELIETAWGSIDDLSLLEFKANALRGLARWADLKITIAQLMSIDIEKGFGVLYQSMVRGDFEVAIDLSNCLTEKDIRMAPSSRQLDYIVGHLEKSARLAKREQSHEAGNRLFDAASRISDERRLALGPAT